MDNVAPTGLLLLSSCHDLLKLEAIAGYVSPKLQFQVQLCQQPHHRTLHPQRLHMSVVSLSVSPSSSTPCWRVPCTTYSTCCMCSQSGSCAQCTAPHEAKAPLLDRHKGNSRLALSSVAAHGEMDSCCKRRATFGFLPPACATLSAPSFPIM